MESLVKSAKSIDEAVSLALEELKVNREEVTVTVLEEPSRGFLGLIGTRPAKVEVAVNKNPERTIRKLLESLLEEMNMPCDIEVKEVGKEIYVDIKNMDSVDEGILIGKRGSTLDALQYILNISLHKEVDSYKKVVLNIANYREKREKTLIDLAKKLAKTVKKTKKPIKLEPMNSYERKIIHSALQEDRAIETLSEGHEPNRRLVVQLKK